jgi:hypothetical protein
VSDSFACRWYDANADLVAYDRDLAVRLVRTIIDGEEEDEKNLPELIDAQLHMNRPKMNIYFVN